MKNTEPTIFFDGKEKIFYLENEKITCAFWIDPCGTLQTLYFGEKVGHDLIPVVPKAPGQHAVTRKKDGYSCDPSLISAAVHTSFGGDSFEPSLSVVLPDGARRLDLICVSHREAPKSRLAGLPSVSGGKSLLFELMDPAVPAISVTLSFSIQAGQSAVESSVLIRNCGKEPVTLTRAYSFSLQIPAGEWDTVVLHGQHAQECQIDRRPLSFGLFSVGTRRGISSSSMNPFLALCENAATETSGRVYAAALVYSGSHVLSAEKMPSGNVRFQGGVQDGEFTWKLDPGEAFQTPEAVLCFSSDGLGGMSRAFHDLFRAHLIPQRRVSSPRPVVFNNWEGTHFTFNGEKLRAMADSVAGTGIDTFVLDDGWFGKRNDSTSGLGDWFTNEEKLGGPLSDLVEYVHQKGMKFGLWFEPEMISRDSDLFRAHPDWVLREPHHEPVESRNQWVLDLGRAEVRACIADRVNRILAENRIDYVKWDMNRDLAEGYSSVLPPERQGETFHRYVLGLYDLLDRVVNANPDVFFEGCSSGGCRFDAGMLAYFPQIWASDNTDAYSRTRIQYGTSLVYPPSSISCHVSSSPNASYGSHFVPFASRASLAQFGATGYEFDPTKLPEQDLASISGQIETYRGDEDLILNGDLYRLLSPFEGEFFAVMNVSRDRRRARLLVFRRLRYANVPLTRASLQGLDPELDYDCAELGGRFSGATLMRFGVPLRLSGEDGAALVLHFRAVN